MTRLVETRKVTNREVVVLLRLIVDKRKKDGISLILTVDTDNVETGYAEFVSFICRVA